MHKFSMRVMTYFKKIWVWVFAADLLLAFSCFGQNANCPVIDSSAYKIKQPSCGKSDGSITGIKVQSSGTKILYFWHDVNNKNIVIGRTVNLTDVAAGTYMLEVTDNSGCGGSVYSKEITLEDVNAIQFNDENVIVHGSGCGNDGSIKGIVVSNATLYTWVNVSTGDTVLQSATQTDLTNVPPGTYQLTASNGSCQYTSKDYEVSSSTILPRIVGYKITPGTCGALPSVVEVSLSLNPDQDRLTYYFFNKAGLILSTGFLLPKDIPNPVIKAAESSGADSVSLYVYNNVCLILLGKYYLPTTEMSVSVSQSVVSNDHCNQKLGYIYPAIINGGRGSNKWVYEWTDASTGKIVGLGKTLDRVGAGTYNFKVTSES
ncbi:MAG TPA: carboxypeptidase-like regulatory domain-containing protein, partial [Mucilaginibacter sp.]|nr:carboxypeptidase-like regulatory domain-containing protein [Mucilaginibacter sp.]